MNKNILITGTSRGIGKALSIGFLETNKVFGCSRSDSDIEHKNYKHFCIDVCDENKVIDMVRGIKRESGKIDVLINNAGAASMNHLLTTNLNSVNELFNVNFMSAFLFTREVGKIMSRQKYGKIVNFSSVAAALNLEGEAIYAAAKAAIENFTRTSAKELGKFNINVNAIGISPTMTNLIKAVPKNKIDELLEKQTIKNFCEFDDIKNTIDFLIDDKSKMVTGQIIYLGGVW
ncbi:SDR family NAD(P)-dependent oxidoreductase [Campylobacter sp. RM16192]|uniref:SDR family NAD(P)-dependent oxidoreductase n=1 Tax=Campylobacter sp. RM16192 TaxID=1660080 RepID=UPI0014527C49|nr:SDR family oxidoreductase [Campylobacter sp. RM16192]QCD51836.1 short-chain dehydrogenase/reductase [Campylobacter sp. RM16192]